MTKTSLTTKSTPILGGCTVIETSVVRYTCICVLHVAVIVNDAENGNNMHSLMKLVWK